MTAIMQVQLLIYFVYIGMKAVKTDNICGTGTTWLGYGDVQPVERKYVAEFMKHPDVWMTQEAFEKMKEPQNLVAKTGGEEFDGDDDEEFPESFSAPVNVGGIIGLAGLGSAFVKDLAHADLQAELSMKAETATIAENAALPASTEPANPNAQSSGDINRVKAAIQLLDPKNDTHFSSTNGVPIVGAVRTAANDQTISVNEVRTAWAEMKPEGGK